MPCLARQLQAWGASEVWGWAFLLSAPTLCSPTIVNPTTGRAINVEFYLHLFPKNVRGGAKAQIQPCQRAVLVSQTWGGATWLLVTCQALASTGSSGCSVRTSDVQTSQRAGTSSRTGSSPWYRDTDAILSKRRRASAPSFITALLSHCQGSFFGRIVPRKWWNNEFGMRTPKLFIL